MSLASGSSVSSGRRNICRSSRAGWLIALVVLGGGIAGGTRVVQGGDEQPTSPGPVRAASGDAAPGCPRNDPRSPRSRAFDLGPDPETTLDLVVKQTRVLKVKQAPRRVLIADECTAIYNLTSPTELLLQGVRVGTTTLNLWFPDSKDPHKLEAVSFFLHVLPDPEDQQRLARALKRVAAQINMIFCSSSIDIDLVGDKIVVTGRAGY